MNETEPLVLAAERARITEIDLQILELECSLRALRAERDLLQGRLDAFKYPVLALPNEIVIEIFVHFLPLYPEPPPVVGLFSPIVLGQVCQKWREIILSTSALWKGAAVSLNRYSNFDRTLRLLETSLQRSGSRALSIAIDCITLYESVVTPFMQTILSHCARWEHLKLCVPPGSLACIQGPLPMLCSLEIPSLHQFTVALGNDASPILAFQAAPCC
ncbi:hypothetical protein DFH07DRAFT_928418 [Mycena maculata]|uniref:F-box domain-containing protein n=1 Tax=Mycena maculata TaxID=230809 RepID=A0AAD7I471_9AGAR|nr:hypothetical protein DFH07DRAFT_928418 [Mycena maculata]